MADLRTRVSAMLTPAAQARKDNAEADFAADQALQASVSSELSKGWTSAGLSERANQLMWDAASAYKAGDTPTAQRLEAEGMKTAQLAQTWAPTVKNFTDIDSLGGAAKWAMGALGNVRSSVVPAAASLAGGLAGGLATRSLKGAQLGAMAASSLAGYDQMANETAGGAMMDPTIRATRSYDDILNTSRVSGAIQAPLEGLVPGAMGAVAMGAGRSLAKAGVKGAMLKAIGGGAAGEFGTEFAQDLVGQGAQNSLKGKGLTDDLNYQQALNAGAAGAVAGGAMGGVGGAASIAHGVKDDVVDVTTDPRKLIDMGAAAAGKMVGEAKKKVDEQLVKLDDYVAGLNVDPDRRRVMGIPGAFDDERDLEGTDIHAMRKPYADRLAAKILDPQSTASEEEKRAATSYAQHGDPFMFGDELTIADGERKQSEQAKGIADELNGTTKKSRMRPLKPGEVSGPEDAGASWESIVASHGADWPRIQEEIRSENQASPKPGSRLPGVSLEDNTPEFTDAAPADPDAFAAKRETARRQAKDFTRDIPILADIWGKQGIDDGIISEVSKNVEPAQRESAIAIMTWVSRGFKGADGELIVPEKLVSAYGKGAEKLVSNAYDLAVKQGMLDPNESRPTFDEVKGAVRELAKRQDNDLKVVFDMMTPIAQAKFKGSLEGDTRAEKVRKMGPVVKELRAIANGGDIEKHDAILDSWFGPRKNEVLDHFYEEKQKPAQVDHDGQDDGERISGLAEDDAFAQREEQGLSDSTEHGFTKVKHESVYEYRDKDAGPDGEYFDLTNDEHSAQLEALKASRVRKAKEAGEDPTLYTMDTVGIVDREIEKRQHQKAVDAARKRNAIREYARSLGKTEEELLGDELETANALPPGTLKQSERKKAVAESKPLHPNEIRKLRRELAEKHLGIKAPKLRAGAGPEETKAHERALRDHERDIEQGLARLNKSRVAVRVTKSEMPNDLGFSDQEVSALRLSELDLRRASALVTKGVLVFDNGKATPYATTARKIIAMVLSKGGDAGFTGSLDEPGDRVRRYRMLQDGVTSLMQAGGFTRVGYIDKITPNDQPVKPVWMKKGEKNFHDALPIAGDFRVKDARQQRSEYDARQERESLIERAVHKSEGGAINRLMRMRIRSFMLRERDHQSLIRIPENKRRDEHKKKLADHDVAVTALKAFEVDQTNVAALKTALRKLTGSGELHYTPREAGLLVQAGMHTLTERQVAMVRDLKRGIGRSVKDKRFKAAQDAVLKFFDKDRAFEELKKRTDDLVDWRERATDFINWKLSSSRLASAAADDFHATGDIESLREALYKITGDDQYIQSSVASEDTRTGKPDDADILEHGTLRDDPNKTVGTKETAINRDKHGYFEGDDNYTAGMMTGTGDSTRRVKDAVEGVREVKSGVTGKADGVAPGKKVESRERDDRDDETQVVIDLMRKGVPGAMRELLTSSPLEQQGLISRIKFFVANFSAGGIKVIAPRMTNEQAASILSRAETVLQRAIVYSKEGEQSELAERNSTNGPRGAVVQVDTQDVRGTEGSVLGGGPRNDQGSGAVAGEVQRHGRQGMAGRPTSDQGSGAGVTGGGSASTDSAVQGDVRGGTPRPSQDGSGRGNKPAGTSNSNLRKGEASGDNEGGRNKHVPNEQNGGVSQVTAVTNWINKAIAADPKKLKAVIALMTEGQLTKVLDVLDGKQFLKNLELDNDEIAKLGNLYDVLVGALPANKDGADVLIQEHNSSGYRERTKHNADSADATVAIATDFETGGERLTARLAAGKIVQIPIARTPAAAAKALISHMKKLGAKSLNVAGNGIYTLKEKLGVTQAQVNQYVYDMLREVHDEIGLNKIVTGGQTGVDIAGAIAARKLSIPVEVTMPKGFLQRDAGGKDFTQTREDVLRQIEEGAAELKESVTKKSNVKSLDAKRKEKFVEKVKALTDNLSDEDMAVLQNDIMSSDWDSVRKIPSILKGWFDTFMDDYRGAERERMMARENIDATHDEFFQYVIDYSDDAAEKAIAEFLLNRGEIGAKSKVKADAPKNVTNRTEAEAAAREHLTRVLGDKIKIKFNKAFRDGTSGAWTKGQTVNTIRIALNSDVLGTAYHESMHEFFDILGRHGGKTTQDFLKMAAGNKRILNRLSQLLDGQPDAQAQLTDPEEALAYMYQFWKAGQLNLGPDTKSWFQKTADYFRSVLGMVTDEMKAEQDLLQVEFVLAAFDSGRFAKDDTTRAKLVGKINDRLEAHTKALENVGGAINTVIDVAGKYVLSAESVVENTKNKHMIEELRLWNQKTGEAMGSGASFFEAVSAKRNQFSNRLENVLAGKDKDDIELARKGLSTNKAPTHPPAKEIYDAVRKMMDDLFEYAQRKKVARLDPETHEWVGIQKRSDYYPQVWDAEALLKDGAGFKALLLKHHMKELEAIAEKANNEVKAGQTAGANTASAEAKPGEVITPELVADAILRRVLNSGGHVELDESTSDLGMSPVAAAVNRRELSWIDAEVFDAFKSKDLVKTMTSYISGMVKRAEHTERFGRGGELTKERADKAFLFEMDGDKLVKDAEGTLPAAIDAWKKSKAVAMKNGMPFDEPFPTLRSVGEKVFGAREGAELLKEARAKAIGKLEQAYRAVMAMEGTLGNDISENMRALNSWMMTYQNFRLLSTTLFSSFADVVGLVVNGGELGDAWDAFTTGVKEVKLGWENQKSKDVKAQRAEMWGTVDAGSTLDALGQTYGSVFLTGTAKRMSDSLFKWNGMEAWNRAMRITATSVAERVIKQYKSEGFDASDKATMARFEELFGKGFDPKDIKLDAEGNLDLDDVKNQAAVSKWVNGAILRPNAAHRTIWGSDPHYQILWHMKQFTYTFQAVILNKAVEQAKLGNYRPALVAMAGYVPVIIAADAIKELIIPGDEPAWMKSGLAGMLKHGVDRAGLLGIGQMGYDSFATDFGVGLTGPAVSQVLHAPFDENGTRTALRALPFGNLAGRLAD